MILAIAMTGLASGQTTKPAIIPTDAKNRKVHPTTRPGEVLDLSIAELGNFDFDPDAKDPQIPDDVKALSGVMVKLHGYMITLDQANNITRFALVPAWGDDQHPPKIQQTIVVTCPEGKAVKYCPDEIVIQGRLKVGIVKDDGFIVQAFGVDAASVKPAAK